jgi:hypothetical protein
MDPRPKGQCAPISRRRRQLQLAIDAEYAPGDANSAFRKQFGLQADKAMSYGFQSSFTARRVKPAIN